MIDCEVLIVGGGPSGSTAAWQLVKAGYEVIILDKKTFPRTKLCAGWITPKVIKDLQININTYPHTFQKLKRLNYYFFKHLKIPIFTIQYSIRRYEFDHWLLKRSNAVFYHHKVERIEVTNNSYIIDDTYRCKILIGAGGTHCPVYRIFFSKIFPRDESSRIVTLEQEFPYDVDDPQCYLWIGENKLTGYSWYVPKGENYLNVGIGGTLSRINSDNSSIIRHWDMFTKKLISKNLISNITLKPMGYNYYLRSKDPVLHIDNAYIIGDAVGLATLDMGEGIGPAVQSGLLAANSIINHTEYSVKNISKYSFPSILFRKE